MRVVVTGGAGFVGSHLCEFLLDRGDAVVCVDDLSSGRRRNMDTFLDHPRFRFVHADVCDGLEALDGHGPVDAVAHLASPASPPDYHGRPLETLAVGSRGTEAALELAYRHGARFVITSTSEIYGDPLVHPQPEDYCGNVNSVGPRSVYDESKRYAEALTAAYRRTRGVDTGIVRVFNTYGPRMRPEDGRVVTSFITQALTGAPLTVYGDGSQTRSFCFVSDLVRGLVAMLDGDRPGPINLGNPEEHTVLDLAGIVRDVVRARESPGEGRASSALEFHPLPVDDPQRRRPVIARAAAELDWEPEIGVYEGLARTVDHLAAHPDELRAAAVSIAGAAFEGDDVVIPTPRVALDDRDEPQRISVIGTGYLGVVHAVCMAALGHEVIGVDVDPEKIRLLSAGVPSVFEPGLPELLTDGVESGRLRFTTDLAEALDRADVHFLCVGTPQRPDGPGADLRVLHQVVDAIAAGARRPALVVGKSTVPVGTARALEARLAAAAATVDLVWNPEFLREGLAVADTMRPDRIVIGAGACGDRGAGELRRLYRPLLATGIPLVETDLETAELVKVAANSFLASKLSFVNAMAEVCEATGADVLRLTEALGYDERIGSRYLRAGIGFGGGCLPKDIRAFRARAEELGVPAAVAFLREVDDVNLRRRLRAVGDARELVGGDFHGKRVAVLGAAFKPDSDDVRDSPALDVATRIRAEGAEVRVHDPVALANAQLACPDLDHCTDVVEMCADADVVLHLTEWADYREIDPVELGRVVRSRRLVDGRNALDVGRWQAAGWTVRALGRPLVAATEQGAVLDVPAVIAAATRGTSDVLR